MAKEISEVPWSQFQTISKYKDNGYEKQVVMLLKIFTYISIVNAITQTLKIQQFVSRIALLLAHI
ncbi:hypothetical protein BK708_21380 [Bacillus thuringiensis serovar yunnanensis]|nr:hypothetical protein BK708_21380 [Bacillus thuringiensis serovar yunnanensis]